MVSGVILSLKAPIDALGGSSSTLVWELELVSTRSDLLLDNEGAQFLVQKFLAGPLNIHILHIKSCVVAWELEMKLGVYPASRGVCPYLLLLCLRVCFAFLCIAMVLASSCAPCSSVLGI